MSRRFEFSSDALAQSEGYFALLAHSLDALAECGDALETLCQRMETYALLLTAPESRTAVRANGEALREGLLADAENIVASFVNPQSRFARLIALAYTFTDSLAFGQYPFDADKEEDVGLYTLWHNFRMAPSSTDVMPDDAPQALRDAHAAVVAHVTHCPACTAQRAEPFVVDMCPVGRDLQAALDVIGKAVWENADHEADGLVELTEPADNDGYAPTHHNERKG